MQIAPNSTLSTINNDTYKKLKLKAFTHTNATAGTSHASESNVMVSDW